MMYSVLYNIVHINTNIHHFGRIGTQLNGSQYMTSTFEMVCNTTREE
jgi:hypothetical protein